MGEVWKGWVRCGGGGWVMLHNGHKQQFQKVDLIYINFIHKRLNMKEPKCTHVCIFILKLEQEMLATIGSSFRQN